MAASFDNQITVGDRQVALRWLLQTKAGTPWPLTTVEVRMVDIETPEPPKINWAAAVVEAPGIATYAFTATDVNTAGTYAIQMRDTNAGGKAQHWPVGRVHLLKIHPVV